MQIHENYKIERWLSVIKKKHRSVVDFVVPHSIHSRSRAQGFQSLRKPASQPLDKEN
jgi:hypothetical protein